MRKNIYFFAILIATALLSSCSTSYVSNIDPKTVSDVQFFEPISAIELIEELNSLGNNDTINLLSNQILNDILRERTTQFPITDAILFQSNDDYLQYSREMLHLAAAIRQDKGIEHKLIPEIIAKLLKSKGKRFGMTVIHTGYIRTLPNYIANEAIEVLKGAIFKVPIISTERDRSTLYLMIFDALNNNIALYDIRDASNANPLDRYIIRNHYKSILEDYFD